MSGTEPSSSDTPAAAAVPRPRSWSRPDVWMLGVFSVIGLIGFIATFVLIVMRSPSVPVQRVLTDAEVQRLIGPPGERGPAGPAGPRGAAGDPGLRILRSDCATGNCTVECADDEVLLNAYCNPNRTAATYPAEHSAQCRTQGRGRVEVVAACVKSSRR
jgi:hypothetical protein